MLEFVPSTMTCAGAEAPLRNCSVKPAWMMIATAASDRSIALRMSAGVLAVSTDLEPAARGEMRDELPTFLAVIEIEHGRRHVVNLEGRRIAEENHLHQHWGREAKARPGVAPQSEKFFVTRLRMRPNTTYPSVFRKARVARISTAITKTTSAAICAIRSPRPLPLRKIPLRIVM